MKVIKLNLSDEDPTVNSICFISLILFWQQINIHYELFQENIWQPDVKLDINMHNETSPKPEGLNLVYHINSQIISGIQESGFILLS